MVSKFNDQQWLMESNLFGKRKIQRPDYRRATMIDTKNIKKIDEKSSNGRGTMQHLRVHKTVGGGVLYKNEATNWIKAKKKNTIDQFNRRIDRSKASTIDNEDAPVVSFWGVFFLFVVGVLFLFRPFFFFSVRVLSAFFVVSSDEKENGRRGCEQNIHSFTASSTRRR